METNKPQESNEIYLAREEVTMAEIEDSEKAVGQLHSDMPDETVPAVVKY